MCGFACTSFLALFNISRKEVYGKDTAALYIQGWRTGNAVLLSWAWYEHTCMLSMTDVQPVEQGVFSVYWVSWLICTVYCWNFTCVRRDQSVALLHTQWCTVYCSRTVCRRISHIFHVLLNPWAHSALLLYAVHLWFTVVVHHMCQQCNFAYLYGDKRRACVYCGSRNRLQQFARLQYTLTVQRIEQVQCKRWVHSALVRAPTMCTAVAIIIEMSGIEYFINSLCVSSVHSRPIINTECAKWHSGRRGCPVELTGLRASAVHCCAENADFLNSFKNQAFLLNRTAIMARFLVKNVQK